VGLADLSGSGNTAFHRGIAGRAFTARFAYIFPLLPCAGSEVPVERPWKPRC